MRMRHPDENIQIAQEGVPNPLLHRYLEVMTPYWEHERRVAAHYRETGSFLPLGDGILAPFAARGALAREYAWAVPTHQALTAIAEYSPHGVVEIGAGTGYWAGLLRDMGVDVVAYDAEPYDNTYARGRHSEVLCGGPDRVRLHPHRTLLLCWPPFWNGMANQALRAYLGDTVVYIGEDSGGCTGGRHFHKRLDRDWDCVLVVAIPQWEGLHDEMFIYRRKGVTNAIR